MDAVGASSLEAPRWNDLWPAILLAESQNGRGLRGADADADDDERGGAIVVVDAVRVPLEAPRRSDWWPSTLGLSCRVAAPAESGWGGVGVLDTVCVALKACWSVHGSLFVKIH